MAARCLDVAQLASKIRRSCCEGDIGREISARIRRDLTVHGLRSYPAHMKGFLLPLLAVIVVLAAPLAVAVETNSTDSASTNQTASVSTNVTVTVDGVKYERVRFERATPATVKIWHSTGIAVVPMAKLPPEIQQQLGYDPQKAAEWQASQIELQAAQQRKRAEQEAAKQEAEIEKHTYSVKLLNASFESIPNGTIIVVNAFTDGHMGSMSDPSARGFSSFSFDDGHYNSFGGICQTGGDVFNELLSVQKTEAFQMIGSKQAYGDMYSPTTAFVVTKVVRLDPEFWCSLGAAYDRAGKLDEAIDAYNYAIKLKPDYAEAWFKSGVVREKEGRNDKALADLRHAVKIRPDYAEAWYGLGTIYNRSGLTDEAITAFRQALKFKPDNAEAWLGLGAAYRQAGQTDEADAAIQRAKGLNAELSK